MPKALTTSAEEIAWLRAEFIKVHGAELLRRLDARVGAAEVDRLFVAYFRELLAGTVTAIHEGRVDIAPMNEEGLAELEDSIIDGIGQLSRLPELKGVRVAETLVRFQGSILRSMRRTQRRGGAQRRATSRDQLYREFEENRQPNQDRKVARHLLAQHEPGWRTGTEQDRIRKIDTFLRNARRKRGQR